MKKLNMIPLCRQMDALFDLDVFQCLDCGKLTTCAACGYCGGLVELRENLDQADEHKAASNKRVRALRGGRSKRSIRR